MTEHRIIRRRRHVARSARILSTGLSATAILGITAAFGAAERGQSADQSAGDASQQNVSGIQPSGANGPSALAPLGTPAIAAADAVTQFPATDGTVTLPSAATPIQGTVNAQSSQTAVVQTAPSGAPVVEPQVVAPAPTNVVAPDTSPALTPATAAAPVDTTPIATAPATVAPIAPAEPPAQLILPPAPSRGSSGGSR